MDHFMEEVVVKHNRGVENALYILSNIVMVLSALWALMCIQMLFMQFSIYGLIEALVTAGVAVLLFLRRRSSAHRVRVYLHQRRSGFCPGIQQPEAQNARHHAREECRGVRSGGFQRFPQAHQHARLTRRNWFLNRGAKLYYFYYQKENQKTIIILEPSDELVEMIRKYLPHGAYQE